VTFGLGHRGAWLCFVTDIKELHRSKPPATGFVALAISARNQLQIPGAFGTLPQGISTEGVVSGTSFVQVSDASEQSESIVGGPTPLRLLRYDSQCDPIVAF
jgi:hypothetical protein